MATTQERKYQCSTFEIEHRSTQSEERFPSESQLTTNAPLLESLHHDERVVSNSEDGAHSAHETVQSIALDFELPNAPLLEKQSELPRGWPTSPQPVNVSVGTTIWNVLIDIFLLALSIAFFAFALFVIWYNGKPTNYHRQAAERFEQASAWGPTIYPILFASVVGRATHAILLWRLERGERVGTLDILAGSTSLTSTVVSQFHLRLVSYAGLGLVAIWMLSPVGGQSSFRQISFGPRNLSEHAEFFHVVPGPDMWTPDVPVWKSMLDTVYLAAIISPTARDGSPRDAWGHIKVPRIECYEGTSIVGDEGWYKTENGTLESYSSFIGIPIGGIDSAEFIDYSTTIQATYFHLICDPYFGELQFTFNRSGWLGHLFWNENTTERVELHADDLKPFAFVINSTESHISNCSVVTAYVEVEVTCPTYTTCFSSRVRRSRLAHPPVAYTQLRLLTGSEKLPWERVSVNVSEVDEGGNLGMDTFSQSYLDDPGDVMGIEPTESSELPPRIFAIRLGQMLNAYWTTMNGKGSIVGRLNDHTNRSDGNMSWSSYRDGILSMDEVPAFDAWLLARTWPSTGTKRSNIEVFHAHYGWVIALIVSSTVLITASLIPFYIRTFLSYGPDILMNLSSLAVRDNPYVALPATGTYLDAADRSRYLKDMRIRFGDVEEGSETGRLVIGRLDGDVALLRKGRKYV